MKRNSILEIDSKKYISSRIACEVWGLSQNTVAKYCRSGRIKNCFKGAHNQWYIPIDTVRPLSDIEIHRLLFLTLQLKNDPTLEIDWYLYDAYYLVVQDNGEVILDMGQSRDGKPISGYPTYGLVYVNLERDSYYMICDHSYMDIDHCAYAISIQSNYLVLSTAWGDKFSGGLFKGNYY